MTHDYELVETGGSSYSSKKLYVYLYPNTSGEVSACKSGGEPAEAVIDAADQLYSDGVIGMYAVYRFPSEDSGRNYADLDFSDYSSWDHGAVAEDIKDFLQYDNGTGSDLTDYYGVHQLVHDGYEGCDGWDADSSSADHGNGAGAYDTDPPAFTDYTIAWSPVCANSALTRNAAVQEMIHGCTDEQGDDDHRRGTVDAVSCGMYSTCYAVTPMLTYHWDDDYLLDSPCSKDSDTADSHTQTLTECTKDEVDDAATKYA